MRRRTFLAQTTCAAASIGAAALGCRSERPRARRSAPVSDPPASEVAMPRPPSAPDTIDDALELLADYGHGGGNHAPMGAEALIAIGRGDDVVAWTEWYMGRENMVKRPTGRVLDPAEQKGALGAIDRIGDWNTTFRRAIDETPWPDLLRAWLPRLLPGLAGAATHGIIRTAHATRSLERADTPLRRNELADSLAYWAAYHQPILPLSPRAAGTARPRLASAVLSEVPIVPRSARVRGMTRSLHARAEDPAFAAAAAAAAAAPGREIEFLGDLTATFARLYATHGADKPIPFIHAVTGPAAIRLLWPHLDAEHRADAMSYAWQTAAGLWSSFAPRAAASADGDADGLPEPSQAAWETALARAVDAKKVHTIKLAEVCWRESRAAPGGAAFLAAAQDVAERL